MEVIKNDNEGNDVDKQRQENMENKEENDNG